MAVCSLPTSQSTLRQVTWHYQGVQTDPPWRDVFEILDENGGLLPDQGLPLTQVTENGFRVDATLRYVGPTGLDPGLDDQVRVLAPDAMRSSDLASVPAFVRWFERNHGVHSPAAIFHDHFIGDDSPVTPVQADRYFLHQLAALGVPTIKRHILWAAVALRTQWVTNRFLLLVWAALSVTGLVLFVLAGVGVDLPSWMGGRWLVMAVASIAPLPASLLWRSQRWAAVIAAVNAVWAWPATVAAFVTLGIYKLLERLVAVLGA